MPSFSFNVPEDFCGSLRLDKFIALSNPLMNRSKLKSGAVNISVNGKPQKISFKVKAGDKIEVLWEEKLPSFIEPEDIPLDIIYEDDDVCVINKPQGMVTHPACGNWNGTLVNALLFHFKKQAIPFSEKTLPEEIRPGIVHRLDKDTSGIIITAKNRDEKEFLSAQFLNHKHIFKEYICICFGHPHEKSGVIKTKIVRDLKDRRRFKAVPESSEEGKIAVSVYKCVACYGEYSLVKVRILTGRTHQIRVHMKYLNCPVLGDPLYFKSDKKFPSATLMLHSRKLSIFVRDGQRMTFKAPLPERFKKIMKILHRDFKKVIP